MKIGMIAAMGKNRELGYKNRLPWLRMDKDMKRFHDMVKDKVVIMGYNSYNSLPIELGWRYIIVVSEKKDTEPKFERSEIVESQEDALETAKERVDEENEEVIIAGGGKTYADFLPYADNLYLTYIDGDFEADVYFPEFKENEWEILEKKDYEVDEKNPHKYSFLTMRRNNQLKS